MLGVALALLVFPSAASAQPPRQGVYQECEPANVEQCQFELAMASNAGFQLVLNYSAWYGTQQQVLEYASEAASLGLQIIWPFNGQQFLDDPSSVAPLVSLVNGLPATWGYYVGDETPASEEPAVAGISATIRRLSTRHLMFVANSPTGDASNLTPFHADAGWLGGDSYPVGTAAPLSYVQRVADAVHKVAHSYDGKHSVMVLQAFSWPEYGGAGPFPSEQQMRAMRDYANAGDPDVAIELWYSEYDVLRSADPSGNWNALAEAAL